MSFPKDFVWGASASSYQIEGAAYEDGKGLSVWDMFCKTPGKVYENNTGDFACDHYHRYAEDVQLMAKIGLQAYRLSLSWPRILPEGTGAVNAAGLAFYDRLLDTLLQHNIQPWVTLFHWDFPYELYCRGGWLQRESADWFAEYTQIVVDKFSDRVSHWITQNEPQCYITFGHQTGENAPGLKLGFAEVLRAAHHSLLAHGKAVQVIRARAQRPPVIGAAPVAIAKVPASLQAADIAAARAASFAITNKSCWSNTWFADPMILGHYPEDGLRLFGQELPARYERDLATICQPLDFYGCNIYFDETVRALPEGGYEVVPKPLGPALSTMPWQVTPEVLYWGPKFLFERYRLPIVVTENGMANCDWIHLDGNVHDPQRIDYLTRYLQAYHRALAEGVVAKGYFVWSMLDNFEWAFGYKSRFGLVYVDYATQQRVLKDSALWYREVIRTHGAHLL